MSIVTRVLIDLTEYEALKAKAEKYDLLMKEKIEKQQEGTGDTNLQSLIASNELGYPGIKK